MKILRTNSSNKDFKLLVEKLDNYLSVINGDNDAFFRKLNKIDDLKHVVLIYEDDEVAACGAFKEYNNTTIEIKRMYVGQNHRRKGCARAILYELESWAKELSFCSVILETSTTMKGAVLLYKNYGYIPIKNYGQYINVESSICFSKSLLL